MLPTIASRGVLAVASLLHARLIRGLQTELFGQSVEAAVAALRLFGGEPWHESPRGSHAQGKLWPGSDGTDEESQLS